MTETVHISDLTIDPEIQLATRGVDPQTVQTYVIAISNEAKMPPVVVFSENGTRWLADGFHRVEAARFLGLAEIEAETKDGTRQDALIYAATANVTNGKPMSQAEKREAGVRLIDHTNWTNREIARRLSVSHSTVNDWASGRIRPDTPRTVTRNGTTYTMDTSNIGRREDDDPPVSNLWDIQSDYDPEPQYEPIDPSPPHVSHNSGNNEWYTPPEYIEAARQAMGGIDCDPASSEIANRTIQAETFYTAEDDGLMRQWIGRVWMNPPYSQPLVAQFCEALITKFQTSEILQACVLVNNATDTAWFHLLLSEANCVCFPRGRIKFIDVNGNPNGAPLQGQAVLYFGDNADRFATAFRKFGVVLYAKRGHSE